MKIVFLNREIADDEDFRGSTVVPLNAVAMRDVLASGASYVKIEDFFSYEFAAVNKERIWSAFQALFDKADKIAGEAFGDRRLAEYGPFNLYALILRKKLETQIIYYMLFSEIIRINNVSEVHFLSKGFTDTTNTLSMDRFSQDTYRVVLEEVTAKMGIQFCPSVTGVENKTTEVRSLRISTLLALKKLIFKSGMAKTVYNFTHIGIHESGLDKVDAKALFLQLGWGVYYYSQFFKHIYCEQVDIDKYLSQKQAETQDHIFTIDWEEIKSEIEDLSSLFRFDTTLIIKENFARFCKQIPAIIGKAYAGETYLKSSEPDFVFYTNLGENILPLQMPLYWNKKIVKVCKCHGDSLFDLTVWRNNELKHPHLYLTEFSEFADYMTKAAKTAGTNTLCKYDAVRLNSKKGGDKKQNKLLYVPWLFDPGLSFDVNEIPQPLFFRIQLQILKALNEQNDYEVTYKCLRSGYYNYHYPVPEYIADNFKNIKVSYDPLKSELSGAGFCLLDAPSSSMWEALDMRVPCHSLVWSKSHCRDSATRYYSNYLTFFDSDLDVAEKVRSIMKNNRFTTVTAEEAVNQKMSPDGIWSLFKTLSRLNS